MKKLSLALALCVVGAAHAADTGTDNASAAATPTVAQRLSDARAAIKSNKWQAAQTELKGAVKADPKSADANNLLAYTYRKQASPDLPKAFEYYNIALKLNPKHLGAHEYIGEAYLMDKKPAEAEKHLAELEKICGNKTCEEYEDLAKAIADYRAKNK